MKKQILKNKIYNITLYDGVNTRSCLFSSYSLHKLLDTFIQKDYQELHIVIEPNSFKEHTHINQERDLKQALYRSIYQKLRYNLKCNRISEDVYLKVIDEIKFIKKASKTKKEFSIRYENYKRKNNLIF